MIYVVFHNDYRDSHVQTVLEGPAEPGMDELQGRFDEQVLGVGSRPVFPQDASKIMDWNNAYNTWTDNRKRLIGERFGRLPNSINWEAYHEAFIQWLVSGHGYRVAEYVQFDT